MQAVIVKCFSYEWYFLCPAFSIDSSAEVKVTKFVVSRCLCWL